MTNMSLPKSLPICTYSLHALHTKLPANSSIVYITKILEQVDPVVNCKTLTWTGTAESRAFLQQFLVQVKTDVSLQCFGKVVKHLQKGTAQQFQAT